MKMRKLISAGMLVLAALAGCTTAPKHNHAPKVALVPLKLYWDGQSDHYTTAKGETDGKISGYNFVRIEGYVFSTRQSGTIPLAQYWNSERHDYYLLANPGAEKYAKEHGYQFVRIEGYIFPHGQPGTVPLELFWSQKYNDNFALCSQQSKMEAKAAGYDFHRIEGYLIPVVENSTNSSESVEKL
jgi:hypothetical protein